MTDHLKRIKAAHQNQNVPLEDFLYLLFELDPTGGDYTDELWHELVPMIHDKLPPKDIYTVSVKEAAQQKGASIDTITKAIKRGEIIAIKRRGRWAIDPSSLANWSLQRIHKKPSQPLMLRFGSIQSDKLFVSLRGQDIPDAEKIQSDRPNAHIYSAQLADWQELGVLTLSKGKAHGRFWLIRPGEHEDSIEHKGLFVKGAFDIVLKINDGPRAKQAWGAYKAGEDLSSV